MSKKSLPRKKVKSVKKKVLFSSNRSKVITLVVLLVALPVTLLLVTESQDLRQDAATTYTEGFVITTEPQDNLTVSISQKNGNEITSPNSGKTKAPKQKNSDSNPNDGTGGGGNGQCSKQENIQRSDNGTNTNIQINCNGGQQFANQKGGDGNQTIQKGASRSKNTTNSSAAKTNKDKSKKVKKQKKESLLQRLIDKFRRK